MREDMSKVIVERPRRGGKHYKPGRPQRDEDQQIKHASMTSSYNRGYERKQLNENLAPLARFLHKQVGRPWDDVYSEICKNIRVTSTVQEHIRIHVKQMVETRTSIREDGTIMINGYRPYPLAEDVWTDLYVDPTTGLLCSNPRYGDRWREIRKRNRERQEEIAAQQRSLPGGIELRKIKGVWYQFDMLPIPPVQRFTRTMADGTERIESTGGSAYDIAINGTVWLRDGYCVDSLGRRHIRTTYAASKHQLGRAGLRRYDLSND